MPYPVLEVAAESLIGDEQLGSKPKVWFLRDHREWLFKEARTNTGEDWAEKIAAELARRIGVEAAVVELARCRGKNGSAGQSFIDRSLDNLVHGNELLAGQITGYDRNKRQRQSDHTLDNIVAAVTKLFPEREDICRVVLSELAGYMVLDALIGNTDRHHENWGLIFRFSAAPGEPEVRQLWVAPSFDHASSLGRELSDQGRRELLERGQIATYVRRGRGGIYLRGERHGANPLYLVEAASQIYPDYFRTALQNLSQAPIESLCATIDDVPPDRMSQPAREFSKAVLRYNHARLIELLP